MLYRGYFFKNKTTTKTTIYFKVTTLNVLRLVKNATSKKRTKICRTKIVYAIKINGRKSKSKVFRHYMFKWEGQNLNAV